MRRRDRDAEIEQTAAERVLPSDIHITYPYIVKSFLIEPNDIKRFPGPICFISDIIFNNSS